MRFVVLLDQGPAWLDGRPLSEQGASIDAHVAAMNELFQAGRVLLGGPFVDGSGGIAILDAADEGAAHAMVKQDPAIVAGVLAYRLKALHAAFDAYIH